jgi:hypothetical protein
MDTRRNRRAAAIGGRLGLVGLVLLLGSGAALAQQQGAPPGAAPPPTPQGRAEGGPTGNDTPEGPVQGRVPRGVIQPPAGIDPGIHTTVPEPRPGTTPVIPPPGTPGGDPRVVPR